VPHVVYIKHENTFLHVRKRPKTKPPVLVIGIDKELRESLLLWTFLALKGLITFDHFYLDFSPKLLG